MGTVAIVVCMFGLWKALLMQYLILIAFAGLLAAGQILFKKAAIAGKDVPGVMA